MDSLNAGNIEAAIEDARNKKKTLEYKMNSFINLMEQVEMSEKAAEKAKEEADKYSLEVLPVMEKLLTAQQQIKESNEKLAREVYTRKADLYAEMEALQCGMYSVLNLEDGCIASIDEMRHSLEKRLTTALIKKEAADKERTEKILAVEYQKMQMEKLVQESKNLEHDAKENIKMQKFLKDHGHIVNYKLREEMGRKCQDVRVLQVKLADYEDEDKILAGEHYSLRPIIQDSVPNQNSDDFKESKGRKKVWNKPWIKNVKNKGMKRWIDEQISEAAEGYKYDDLLVD